MSRGRQLPVIQRQTVDPACAISSASGKRQPMTTQIQISHSSELGLDPNTVSGNLPEVNKINALIGHCAASKDNRCIRVLSTEIFEKISSTRTHSHGEETLWSSGWTLIRSELSSPNFNLSVRAERSRFVISS